MLYYALVFSVRDWLPEPWGCSDWLRSPARLPGFYS